jgi:hypothetical protein
MQLSYTNSSPCNDQKSFKVGPVLHVPTSDFDIGPVSIVPAFTWITGLRSCRPFCILLSRTSLKTYISMPVSGALRELSVALCRGNASLCRSGAYVATRAAGRTPIRGLARRSADVLSACLAPRVWVWAVWFGLALRCVALLCGVFVQLHLALFPAGGPFLPSLSVNVSACQRSTDNWKQPKAMMSFL